MSYPISRIWWVVLVIGVLNVIVGVLAVIHPGFTLLALGIVLGFYLLLAAFTAILEGITGDADSRAMSIVVGVVALIAGLIPDPRATGREPRHARRARRDLDARPRRLRHRG